MSPTKTDGRHDCDFAFGRWRVHNRKIANVVDRACTEWMEFEAISELRPILNGLGNFETFIPVGLPEDRYFEAATLRLFDPHTRRWRIWDVSTRAPGHLEIPLEGRFTAGRGQFFSDDDFDGTPVKVRYDWSGEAGSVRWEQSFSYDRGTTWETNWVMTSTRVDTASGSSPGSSQAPLPRR